MIYTLTFSPALDLCMWLNNLSLGKTNRSERELINVGGKGINVSLVLNELSVKSTALGFVGGFVGNEITRRLNDAKIDTDFIYLNDNSRINIKLMGKTETEINAKGPEIDQNSFNKMLENLKALSNDDILIISGSAPTGAIPSVLECIKDKQILTVLDTAGENLLASLKYQPFFIKPNKEELEDMLNITCNSIDDISNGADRLLNMGAKNVAVSLGKDGVLFKNKQSQIYIPAPDGVAINTVGSGDSLVAGFVAGYLKTKDFNFAVKLGVASGSATAFSPTLATKAEIEAILKTIDN